MTRHDFHLIAEVIRDTEMDPFTRDRLVANLVPVLKARNALFKADLFARACGTEERWGY